LRAQYKQEKTDKLPEHHDVEQCHTDHGGHALVDQALSSPSRLWYTKRSLRDAPPSHIA
jgi:hypothetical protein